VGRMANSRFQQLQRVVRAPTRRGHEDHLMASARACSDLTVDLQVGGGEAAVLATGMKSVKRPTAVMRPKGCLEAV